MLCKRRIFTLILIISVLPMACNVLGNPADKKARKTNDILANLEGSEWILTSLHGVKPIEGTNITLQFAAGRMSGYTGCNHYNKYTTTGTGTPAVEIAVTAQLCPEPAGVMEQEAAYLEALRNATVYRLADDRLEVDDARGETILIFARRSEYPMNPADLIGTAWKLTFWGDVTFSEDAVITLSFDSANKVSGRAGCRGYTGLYEASDDRIQLTFLSMIDDGISCTEEQLKQEGEFTTSLELATHYRLSEGRLEIFTARGESLIFEPSTQQ